jgi:hypothetical protein
MTDLADVSPGDIITSARQNLINDYIQDGTHRVTTEAVYAAQTSTAGRALSITRNLDSTNTDSPVAYILQDNASDDQRAVYIKQDGANEGLYVDCTHALGGAARFDYSAQGAGTCYTQIGTGDYAGQNIRAVRNLDSTLTSAPMIAIVQDNASDDQNILTIKQDGYGNGIVVDMTTAVAGVSTSGGMGIFVQISEANTSSNNWAANFGTSQFYGSNWAAFCQGTKDNDGARVAMLYRAMSSTKTQYPLVTIWDNNASDDQPLLMIQNDATGPWIDFEGTKAIATGKTSANEYIQVKTASGTRYLQLFT